MGNYGSGGANFTPDDKTLDLNSSQEAQVKPSTTTQTTNLSDITYSSNTTLASDIYAKNVTIDSGVTITTNGFNFYCSGTFTNNGTITTGTNSAGATTIGGNGTSFTSSYGGSGAGTDGANAQGGSGGSTTVAGGAGVENGTPGNGASATAPTLTTSLINTWYSNGMQNYLQGAGGGAGNGSGGSTPWGVGGNGGYGIYIQANTITAGIIKTIGGSGGNGTYSSGGGGGGGSILLAYGSGGYTAGTYTLTGGAGGTSGNLPGTSGAGITMTFSGQPIAIPDFSYTTNSNSIRNRNSSYQYSPSTTTSTSATTVISQSLTPQTSGLLAIRVLAIIYNNTIGDGVNLLLYNGTTLLDNNSYTQEGLASNPHLTALYYEATYTTGTAQTFSVQFEAVTGGTATCEIQEFTIEEIY